MEFRKNYVNYVTKESPRSGQGMTKQSFKEECDINHIMKRFKRNGILPSLIKKDARYGNFADVGSYQESLNIVMLAQEQFAGLSAEVRDRFGHDPAQFLEFAGDPKNLAEMVKLGLATEVQPEVNAVEEIAAAVVRKTGKSKEAGETKV